MLEPTEDNVEPGEEGTEEEPETTEPAEDEVEPTSEDDSGSEEAGDEEDVDTEEDAEPFMDLKEVPDKLQPVAKRMQGKYTKKNQALAERERAIAERERQLGLSEDNGADSKVDEIRNFFSNNPEGQAMKQVLLNDFREELGIDQLHNDNLNNRAVTELNMAIKKYGKDTVESNLPEIEERFDSNPGVPLNFIIADVLFAKQKEAGKKEVRQKLKEKQKSSLPSGNASINTTDKKEIRSFKEAFAAAEAENN